MIAATIMPHDRPNRVADVLSQFVDPPERLLLAQVLSQLLESAEGPARRAPRLVGRRPLRCEPFLQQVQMAADLLVNAIVHRGAIDQCTQARP